MATFEYTALDATTGAEVSGRLDATDERSAVALLRDRRLMPMEVAAKRAAGTGIVAPPSRPTLRFTRRRDVVITMRQLALMLRAGLTLLQALDVAQVQCPKPGLARALARIRGVVETGRPLSDALAHERRYFPPIVTKLIASAEASGDLDQALDRLANHLERSLEIRMSLLTSLAYPAIVTLAALGVTTFLLVKVIPVFAKFLDKRRIPLPWSTRLLIDTSNFVQARAIPLAVCALAALLALVVVRLRPWGRRATDRFLLAVPVLGGVISAAAMAQLGLTFSTLLKGGVSLLETLRLLSGTVMNAAIAARIDQASEGVIRGETLAAGFQHPTIPPLVTQVIAVGERTGALEDVLDEVGRFYDAEVNRRVKQLTALFEPVVIAVVGGLVGFVYFAFFQVLLQLASRGR